MAFLSCFYHRKEFDMTNNDKVKTKASEQSRMVAKASRDHETIRAEELARISHHHFRVFGPPKGTREYPKWLSAR